MAKTIVVSVNGSWYLLNFHLELVRRLIEEGFTLIALTPHDDHVHLLRELGIAHVPVPIDSQGISPLRDIRLILRYWSALRRIRPAAYLGWTIKPNIYGTLAAHALGIPVINNISGLGTAFLGRRWLTRIVSRLYRLALRRSSTVFFQNPIDRDLFVSLGLVDKRRTVLLPGSGIDVARFSPATAATTEQAGAEPFTFLTVTRLIRDKGVFEYVEAAALVRKDRSDVRFDIVGPLDVANRTAITRAQVADWVTTGAIRYRGRTDDVRPLIAEADCIVLASYREGMPRSLLEAAAMGKPLIATDVPGCTEIARAGQNAILCAPRDARSLADAMQAMLELGPDQRSAMGRRSREIAVAEFDTELVQAKYLAAINGALRIRSNSPRHAG